MLEAGGVESLASWRYALARLAGVAALDYFLSSAGRIILSLRPHDAAFDVADVRGRMELSRFAVCHAVEGEMRLRSPLGLAVATLAAPEALAALARLARGSDVAGLAQESGWDFDTAASFTGLLAGAGLLVRLDDDGTTAERTDAAVAQWELEDALFHFRSRSFTPGVPLGGTYPHAGRFQPPPPLPPPTGGRRIPLRKPDMTRLLRDDPPFARVVEGRASVRVHGDEALTIDELGEFLYRTVRARDISADAPAKGDAASGTDDAAARIGGAGRDAPDVVRRIHPGGGARHPLQVYALVDSCTGLASGTYRYDPAGHALEAFPGSEGGSRLLREAAGQMADGRPPQVLLVLSARFRRMSWKYEGVAYALTLKEVGVVYEAMYLAAAAMGLAACALGAGDARRFARVIGADPLEESSVGEFVLGSMAQERPAAATSAAARTPDSSAP